MVALHIGVILVALYFIRVPFYTLLIDFSSCIKTTWPSSENTAPLTLLTNPQTQDNQVFLLISQYVIPKAKTTAAVPITY